MQLRLRTARLVTHPPTVQRACHASRPFDNHGDTPGTSGGLGVLRLGFSNAVKSAGLVLVRLSASRLALRPLRPRHAASIAVAAALRCHVGGDNKPAVCMRRMLPGA